MDKSMADLFKGACVQDFVLLWLPVVRKARVLVRCMGTRDRWWGCGYLVTMQRRGDRRRNYIQHHVSPWLAGAVTLQRA